MNEEKTNQLDTLDTVAAGNVRSTAVKAKIKAAFIEWLTLPESLRVPPTARQFAAENGISERTLFRWRRQPEVSANIQELASVHARSRFGEVANAIVERAIAGDVAAQKLYLQEFRSTVNGVHEIRVQFGDETELVPFFALKQNQPSET